MADSYSEKMRTGKAGMANRFEMGRQFEREAESVTGNRKTNPVFERQTDPALTGGELFPTGVRPGLDPSVLEYNEEAVSPEEQGIYEQFVNRAMEFVAKKPEAVVDQMNNSKRSVFQNVGKTALMIAQGVEKTAKAGGQEISPEIMLAGGEEIVEMLMELGDAAGIWPFKQDSKEYDEAMNMALMHGAELAGKQVLAAPDAAAWTEQAGNVLAQQVAQEHERGETPPGFFEGLQSQVAGGVNRAINGAQ